MRAWGTEDRKRTLSTAISPSLRICFPGQVEISWKTGHVDTWIKKPPKGFYNITTLLEAWHDHFFVNPPSHFTPQKVKVLFLVGSLRVGNYWLNFRPTRKIVKEYFCLWKKPRISEPNWTIAVECCILRENYKNKTSGVFTLPDRACQVKFWLSHLISGSNYGLPSGRIRGGLLNLMNS